MKNVSLKTKVQESDLVNIVEALRNGLSYYDELIIMTANKLQQIKTYKEPLSVKDISDIKSECIIDELNKLIDYLLYLNGKAEINLRHLNKIV